MLQSVEPASLETLTQDAARRGEFGTALELTVRGYGPQVLGFLLDRLKESSDAEEVFSMFCEDLWRSLPSFAWKCTMRSWCYRLARSATARYKNQICNNPRRHVSLSEGTPSKDAMLSRLVDEVRTETRPYIKTEHKSRIRELRRQLAEEEQSILLLRVDQDLSWMELAVALGNVGELPEEPELKREAQRLRKRFELTKNKLRRLAVADGLLEDGSE